MATSPNFSWPEPDNTDLVKNGALAIRTAVDAIDASMVDLKGGTTGQVLSKTSNTDMDFTWVAQDDSNAIQNAIVDAKGDIIVATAADTPARLAVGTNGQVLKANSATATGLEWSADSAGMTNPMTTTGDTIYSSSGSTPARLGIGTTGQVLTVAGGVPSWATPAGGGGKVLQVVSASTSSSTTIATTTLTDTGITATITPTSSASKILVIISVTGYLTRSTTAVGAGAQLLRGATMISQWLSPNFLFNQSTGLTVSQGLSYLDNPATTSATTYKLQAKVETTANSQQFIFSNDGPSTITLLEIGA
jgi:hypothetical protein